MGDKEIYVGAIDSVEIEIEDDATIKEPDNVEEPNDDTEDTAIETDNVSEDTETNVSSNAIIMSFIRKGNNVQISNIYANYDTEQALQDIEHVYNSDEFLASIPEGETQYQLIAKDDDIDITPTSEPVDINMEEISLLLVHWFFEAMAYTDLIIWKRQGSAERLADVENFRLQIDDDEFYSEMYKYIDSFEYPSTNVLINPDDLYEHMYAALLDLSGLYELYIFNYDINTQNIINRHMEAIEKIIASLAEEVNR